MQETIYRDYDQATLNAQYDNRGAVPDWADLIEEGRAWSRNVRERLDPRMNVPYGESAGERLNVFPAIAPGAPILMFIHGGYWKRLDKDDFDYVAEPFVHAGAAVLNINYDLAPASGIGGIVDQCRAATIWAYRHAAEFNGDPARIHVAGHSAGGHLSAMLAVSDWSALDDVPDDVPDDVVKGSVSVSGVYDLEPIRLCHENEGLDLGEPDVEGYSPIRLVSQRAAPQLLCVGGLETDEFRRQQDAYDATLERAGCPVMSITQAAHNHFDVVFALAQPDQPLCRAVLSLMKLRAPASEQLA